MKVVVIGTRGIPNIQGGVETHCQELYPLLATKGIDITIVRRSCYVSSTNKQSTFKNIKLKDIYAPRKKSIEAIIHTLLAVYYAKKQKADILHIHAIGPALLVPFAKILGLKVVVTHHGADYDRLKWGRVAKFILKLGEKFTAEKADHIIVISNTIQSSLKNLYGRFDNVHLIPNGVNIPTVTKSTEYINSLNLKNKGYIIALGRFVEEKGFHNLIEAYSKSKIKNKIALVIAGDADHETAYSLYLKDLAKKNNVILTGFIKGEPLNELFSNAALFVLPSFHEGLPISLLEAMSYQLDVLVSSIPANLEVELSENEYFKPNNIDELKIKLEKKLSSYEGKKIVYDLTKYNWSAIANKIYDVYQKLVEK